VRQSCVGDELEPPKTLGIAGSGHGQRIRSAPTDASCGALQRIFALLPSIP
jgi:hypothetical protein